MPAHDMYLMGAQTWFCRGCGAWFDLDDSVAVAMYMSGAERLLWATRYGGGSIQRVPSPTF